MADAGRYVVVVRNDRSLPDVVHSAIWPDTPEGRIAAFKRAAELHERSGITFAVSIIEHAPVAAVRCTCSHLMGSHASLPDPEGRHYCLIGGCPCTDLALTDYLKGHTGKEESQTAAALLQRRRDAGLTAADLPKSYVTNPYLTPLEWSAADELRFPS